ncbi:RIO1 family [Musa troglodytarum]|uniref:non-specific serine/threonine protein kinase n=1 Tax=Musa troglodytarum TaxID=320322 RepID=A0A9E7KEV2_9LILI|nr:RIO1 family [Musa troglodytarum]
MGRQLFMALCQRTGLQAQSHFFIFIFIFITIKIKPYPLPSHSSFVLLFFYIIIMEVDRVEKEGFGVLLKQGAEAEARCMTKARRLGVPTPALYGVDPLLHTLTFEYVDGLSVKEILLDFGSNGINEEILDDIATQIGNAVGKLHDGGLIHGDLTTSNMIIKRDTNQLVLIDFGLSFTSTLPEDKAVDLYVLERALLSMHSSCGNVMDKILSAYRKSSKQWSSTMNKLAQVRQRGRKRTMVG